MAGAQDEAGPLMELVDRLEHSDYLRQYSDLIVSTFYASGPDTGAEWQDAARGPDRQLLDWVTRYQERLGRAA